MITSIGVQNLGCFDDNLYTANFNRLTVLVGANNSGKSTIFKGLNLVRQLAFSGGALVWSYPDYYSLQSYRDSVYSHDVSRNIRILTQYQQGDEQYESRFTIQGNNISENDFEAFGQITNLGSDEHRNVASTVWYIAPNRMVIPYQIGVGQPVEPMQPLNPTGRNVIDFLVERYTSRDPNWTHAENWLRKIDSQMTMLKTPLHGNVASTVTRRNDTITETDVNINLQGSGIQNATTIVAAVIFSPDNSTIIIEEPENFLNYGSVETLLDMFNDVISRTSKQIIISTHSWDVLTTYTNDIGNGLTRNTNHVITDPSTFGMLTFKQELSTRKIEDYPLQGRDIGRVMDDMRALWEPSLDP